MGGGGDASKNYDIVGERTMACWAGRSGVLMHIDKGIYASQLRRWFGWFRPCQFYITAMEAFYSPDPITNVAVFSRLLQWIDVPQAGLDLHRITSVRANTAGPHSRGKLRADILPLHQQHELATFYAPYNSALATLLGSQPGWGGEPSDADLLHSSHNVSAKQRPYLTLLGEWARAHSDYYVGLRADFDAAGSLRIRPWGS